MGEHRARKRAHAAVFEACPDCIYCGGEVRATSIDHVPPRVMFNGSRRPKGLEFASCKSCNEGTGRADLVAGLLGRVAPDAQTEEAKDELKRLLHDVNNNVPGLLEEMAIDAQGQAAARTRLPQQIDGGFLRANGPILTAHMQTFATKLGFALYYEVTRKIVPMPGGVSARWFSNIEKMDGTFPQSVFDVLLPPHTLKQGKFSVADQFSYQWRVAEGDRMALFFASFRQSFAVLAFVTTDTSLFNIDTGHPLRIVTPRNIRKFLQYGLVENDNGLNGVTP